MAGDDPTTSDDTAQQTADFPADLAQLNALLPTLHALDVYDARGDGRVSTSEYKQAWLDGYLTGQKHGHTEGYRDAKGGKKSTRIKAGDVIGITIGLIGWQANDREVVSTAGEVLQCILTGQFELSGQKVPSGVAAFLKARTHEARLSAWPPARRDCGERHVRPPQDPDAQTWPRPETLVSEYHRRRAKRLKEQQNKSANS
jgi:hypothetical protein